MIIVVHIYSSEVATAMQFLIVEDGCRSSPCLVAETRESV